MNRTDEKNWAKEELIWAIDARLKELFANPDPVEGAPALDDQTALLRQRNRVVRFLAYGNPKTLQDYLPNIPS